MKHLSAHMRWRLNQLPTITLHGYDEVVEDFAIVIEMHQDKDSAFDQFRHSFIRGECGPVKVHLLQGDHLMDDSGSTIKIDDRMKFMSMEAFQNFVASWIMEHGTAPMTNGIMPTRYLRDARAKVNLFRSFRQMINHNYDKHARAGTLV